MIGNLLENYLYITSHYVIWVFLFLGVLLSLKVMYGSLKFNYHFYIRHGEFCILGYSEDFVGTQKANRIETLCKELNIDRKFVPWINVLLTSLMFCVVFAFCGALWPITTIIALPLISVRILGHKKRLKHVFVEKLEGNET